MSDNLWGAIVKISSVLAVVTLFLPSSVVKADGQVFFTAMLPSAWGFIPLLAFAVMFFISTVYDKIYPQFVCVVASVVIIISMFLKNDSVRQRIIDHGLTIEESSLGFGFYMTMIAVGAIILSTLINLFRKFSGSGY